MQSQRAEFAIYVHRVTTGRFCCTFFARFFCWPFPAERRPTASQTTGQRALNQLLALVDRLRGLVKAAGGTLTVFRARKRGRGEPLQFPRRFARGFTPVFLVWLAWSRFSKPQSGEHLLFSSRVLAFEAQAT